VTGDGHINDEKPAVTAVPSSRTRNSETIRQNTRKESVAHKNDSTVSSEPQEQKREVPPPKNPVSNAIVIRELVRPFTLKNIQELLNQTGKVVDLWLNSIKSVCYAKLETEEQATVTRNAIHNSKWPLANGRLLNVDFATSNEMQQAKDGEKQRTGVSNNKTIVVNIPKSQPPPPAPVPEKKGPTLDDLFKKTISKPCIYYLPLTDEQVAAKKRAKEQQQLQEKEKAQVADKARSPARQISARTTK